MVWLAFDPRFNQEVTLTLPRVQPAGPAGLAAWQREVAMAARLNHPQLAAPSEVSVQDNWPYIAIDRAYGLTLGEWLATHPPVPMVEMVSWICQALEGLAFAHEAGVAHGDLQLHSLLVSEHGTVRVAGLCSGSEPAPKSGPVVAAPTPIDEGDELRSQRARAERDVLAVGLIVFRLLSGHSPLEQDDVSVVISRLPPVGREIVRLPWSTARPVPEALRAIVNRATAAQERQRYLNARTLLRALNGWLPGRGQRKRRPAGVADRPDACCRPSAGDARRRPPHRQARGCGIQRNDELAQQVMQDMALSFELLRLVNANMMQGGHGRAVRPSSPCAVRRHCSASKVSGARRSTLRPWPGPLGEQAAAQLQRLIDQVRLASAVAHALRPAGYDTEVVSLVVMWQNLGRLLIAYHFPEEAQQIRLLCAARRRRRPWVRPNARHVRVAGVAGGARRRSAKPSACAVARHWGLGDEVQPMMRRCPLDRPGARVRR